jgi:hypothetical protein
MTKTGNESVSRTLAIYLSWLLLVLLWTWAIWQLHTGVVVGAAAYLASDLPKPADWYMATLNPISRFSVLVNGSLWLILILWMENILRNQARRGRLARQIALFTAAAAVVLLASYGLILWLG